MIDHRTLKNILKGIIHNEYNNVLLNEVEYFEKKDSEYNVASNISEILYKKLSEGLTEEQKDLLEKLYSSIIEEWHIKSEYLFSQGIKKGLIHLKYLNEIENLETHFLYLEMNN